MKRYVKSIIVAAGVGAVAVSAPATPVFFETFDVHPDNPGTTASQVGGQIGDTVSDYFRWDSSHTSTPLITVTLGATGFATVSWNFTGTGLELEAIYIKGGNEGGNIYKISDGAADFEEIIGSGMINTPLTGNGGNGGNAGISHIDFLVGPGGSTRNVPDGGSTVVLLGGALTALGLIRRKVRK